MSELNIKARVRQPLRAVYGRGEPRCYASVLFVFLSRAFGPPVATPVESGGTLCDCVCGIVWSGTDDRHLSTEQTFLWSDRELLNNSATEIDLLDLHWRARWVKLRAPGEVRPAAAPLPLNGLLLHPERYALSIERLEQTSIETNAQRKVRCTSILTMSIWAIQVFCSTFPTEWLCKSITIPERFEIAPLDLS